MDKSNIFLIISDFYLDKMRETIDDIFVNNMANLKIISTIDKNLNGYVKILNPNYLYNMRMLLLQGYINRKLIYINNLSQNEYYCPYECIGNWRHFIIEYNTGSKRHSLKICHECGSRITPRNYLRT